MLSKVTSVLRARRMGPEENMRDLRFASLIAAVALMTGPTAWANNIPTSNSIFRDGGINGACSLVEAIENANDTDDGQPNPDCAAGHPDPLVLDVISAVGYLIADTVDNDTEGQNATPVITSRILINASSATLVRSSGAPHMRLFYVALGGQLTFKGGAMVSGSIAAPNGTDMSPAGMPAHGGCVFSHGHFGAIDAYFENCSVNAGDPYDGVSPGGEAAGGAIYNDGGVVELRNVTLIDNYAYAGDGAPGLSGAALGGAVYSHNGPVLLNNVTMADNGIYGGGILNGGALFVAVDSNVSTLVLTNSLLARSNNGVVDCAIEATPGSLIQDSHHNVIEHNGNCAGDDVSGDPDFGKFACVGNTCFMTLKPGSSALDNGDDATCQTFDTRGQVRPFGPRCDIGAFESPGYAAATFTLLPAPPGGVACVAASLDTTPGYLSYINFELHDDPEILSLDTCTGNPDYMALLGYDPTLSVTDAGNGVYYTELAANTPATLPSGQALTWSGQVSATATPGTYWLYDNSSASDGNGYSAVPQPNQGSLTLQVSQCTGDCDGDSIVTIGEVTKCINIFLGKPLCDGFDFPASCPMADTSADGQVSIGEVSQCVNRLFEGC